jgi:bacillithiol biosynthesis deacetylase BshB1
VPLDLLVFGPHPDDIEIGLGATVALHVALGHEVGLCDPTLGEMGSNGTVEDRRREAAAAAKVLGVAWRENLEWPDGGITSAPEFVRSAVDMLRTHRPRVIAIPYWKDRHPDHVAASEVLTLAAFKSGLRKYETRDDPVAARVGAGLLHQRRRHALLRRRCLAHHQKKRDALASLPHPVRARRRGRRQTRPHGGVVRSSCSAATSSSAQIGVPYAEGIVVREPVSRSHH